MARDNRNNDIDIDRELEQLNKLLNGTSDEDGEKRDDAHKTADEESQEIEEIIDDTADGTADEVIGGFDFDEVGVAEDDEPGKDEFQSENDGEPETASGSENEIVFSDGYADDSDIVGGAQNSDGEAENLTLEDIEFRNDYDGGEEPKGYVSPEVAKIINSVTERSGYTDIEPMKVDADLQNADEGEPNQHFDGGFDDDSDFTDISSDSDVDEIGDDEIDYSDFSSEQGSTYGYDADAPKFFTESSEYDEKPLDISDFYPPTPDDEDVVDSADTSDEDMKIADSGTVGADESEDEPAAEYDSWEDESGMADDFAQSDAENADGGQNTIIFDTAKTAADEPDDDKTKVFAAVSGDVADNYGVDDIIIDDDNAVSERGGDDLKGESMSESDKHDNSRKSDIKSGKAEDKPKGFMRFVRAIIPWKGDAKKEIVRKIIFIVAFVTMIVMLWQVAAYYLIEPFMNDRMNDNLLDEYSQKTSNGYSSPEMNPKFKSLYEKNNDLVGWITVKDTNINYPVLKGETNKKWERTTFDGESRRFGSIFMDCNSSIDYGAESRNIVIYGHNMMDDKTMFSQLTHYRDDFDFYKKHPTFTFDSLYNDGEWEIFSVMTTNAYAAQNNGYCFDYRKSTFADDNEFNSWIAECKARSCISNNVDVQPTDTILTLQTCVYEFTGARLVIQARRTRDASDKVDVSAASVNQNAIYPQAWYDAKGTKNPHNEVTNAVQFNNTENTDPLEPEHEDETTTANNTDETEPNGEVVTIKTPNSSSNGNNSDNTSVTADNNGKTDKTQKTTKKTSGSSSTTKKNDSNSTTKKPTTEKPTKPSDTEETTKNDEPTEAPGHDEDVEPTESGDSGNTDGDGGDSNSDGGGEDNGDSGDNGGEENYSEE